MKEDAIERNHQQRARDEHRLARMRNEELAKRTQAKFEHTQTMATVKAEQKKVHDGSKRKLKREVPLAQVKFEAKKLKRDVKREEATMAIKSQSAEGVAKLPKPRDIVKQGLRQAIKDQQEQKEDGQAMEDDEEKEE
jgi:hypothetical protein